jgi:hypothetical protein
MVMSTSCDDEQESTLLFSFRSVYFFLFCIFFSSVYSRFVCAWFSLRT